MNYYRSIILSVFLTFLSCNRSDEVYVNLKADFAKDLNYEIKFESVSIPIDTMTLNYYALYSNFTIGNNDYLAGYNSKTHSIDVLNLTDRAFYKHLILHKDGPDMLNRLMGLTVVNWDSIFVYTDWNLFLVDSSGSIKYKKNLSKLSIKEKGIGIKRSLSPTFHTNLLFSKERNSIFLIHTPRNVSFGSESFYKLPFLTEFNIINNTLELVPVYYSNFFIQNKSVGDTYNPCVRIIKNIIFYGFLGESNIYSFNLDSKILETFGARSSYTKNTTTPIPIANTPTKLVRNQVESVLFLNVTYDPYRNLYYRFHYGDQKYQVSDNEYNTFLDKKLYLMIFDKEFRLIKEIKLEDHTYNTEFYGVTREGLMLNANHILKSNYNDNIAQFKLLKINLIDNENK